MSLPTFVPAPSSPGSQWVAPDWGEPELAAPELLSNSHPPPPSGGPQPAGQPLGGTSQPLGQPSGGDDDVSVPRSWTIGELLTWTTERFQQAAIASPRVDAEHLLGHALGCSRVQLYAHWNRLVEHDARAPFREFVRRRLAREPVAYILGRRGFHALGLELLVDRRALIPRPETEHLVDWLLEELRPPPAPVMHVLDVGTGSGAIAVAIKHARPDVRVVGIDRSEPALELARQNAARLGLEVEFYDGDLLDAVVPTGVPDGGFTAVAANLPYVDADELERLDPEVRMFEPREALDGGSAGLEVIERLIQQLASRGVLAAGACVYLEVGVQQAGAVADRLLASGYRDVDCRADFAGIPRIVRGRGPAR